MAKNKQKSQENVPHEFPHVFDTCFDLKSAPEAIRELEKIRRQVVELKQKYSQLHRMLREHGYNPIVPHEI